ncbi:MAG: hypothetical protein BWY65_01556 [Firmicutes bacterium ADurb.Bin373]|nr:hypothetical protein [Bacillota bacterium]OQA08254.1 MAG: hypothetical protein BWY65_01556 [Firmicutes bacterium ADurb.Bin373]
MEYLWLAILVAIILRAFGRQPIGRQPGRYKPRGKFDVPREGLPYNEKEMPYAEKEMPPAGFPAGEPGERRREFNVPPDPARRGGDLTHAGAEYGYAGRRQSPAGVRRSGRSGNLTKELSYGSRQEGPAGERRQSTGPSRELNRRRSGEELFEDGLGRQEVIKGMVWSQILGPRGGIQASRRFRYR